MKQAEDCRTVDFFEGDKRGRGRPRRGDALTDAQRARRYRANRKAQAAQAEPAANKRDGITENAPPAVNQERIMTIEIELNPEQAWALAQFLKRVGFSDYRPLAQDEEEAWIMQEAGEKVRAGLAESGIAPR